MDLNGDGHGDILSGSYSRMDKHMAGLFQVLWGQPDGTFRKAEVLNGLNGEPLIIPTDGLGPSESSDWTENICTRPTAVDWDADGDLDLVVGNFPGTFYLFTGKGDGVFLPEAKPILCGNEPLKVTGYHSDPFVVDWDNDGDLDLLSGSGSGGVHFAENVSGTGQPPELKPFRTVIEPTSATQVGGTRSEDDLTGPSTATRIWLDDINTDGKLDILVGDNVSLDASADESGIAGRTGFVWLYLRK